MKLIEMQQRKLWKQLGLMATSVTLGETQWYLENVWNNCT